MFPRPLTILVVSAHRETSHLAFVGSDNPGLIYDYSGFPPQSYQISYPARNGLSLVKIAQKLLVGAGIPSSIENRGYDHGVFVPLKLMYPEADIPVVQLSLPVSRNPSMVMELGRVLRPLRDQDVLLVGSGMSFHNIPAFFSDESSKLGRSKAFDSALNNATLSTDRVA